VYGGTTPHRLLQRIDNSASHDHTDIPGAANTWKSNSATASPSSTQATSTSCPPPA